MLARCWYFLGRSNSKSIWRSCSPHNYENKIVKTNTVLFCYSCVGNKTLKFVLFSTSSPWSPRVIKPWLVAVTWEDCDHRWVVGNWYWEFSLLEKENTTWTATRTDAYSSKKIGQKTQWYMFIDVLTTSYLYFEHTPLLQRILLFSTALCKLPSFHVIIFRFSRLIDPECCHNLQGGRRLFEQFDTQTYQINDFQLITWFQYNVYRKVVR